MTRLSNRSRSRTRRRPSCRTCRTPHHAPTSTRSCEGNERRGNTRYAVTRVSSCSRGKDARARKEDVSRFCHIELQPGALEHIAGHDLQPRPELELTVLPGLLPMSTTKSQMRPDGALQNMCRPRTPGAMHLPSTERVAPTCQEDKHGSGPKRTRLQRQWPGPHTRWNGDIATRGVHARLRDYNGHS